MGFKVSLRLIWGLSVFLFGIRNMSDGLKSAAGGRLSGALARFASSDFKSMLLGTFVTAAIQSSSATTVMCVSFVNSGIISLRQAISVIMGANIGTTVTAWLLSAVGVQSSNLFVQLLRPSSLSPVVAGIGVAMSIFSKNEARVRVGRIMIAYGVLTAGMDMMAEASGPLTENMAFVQTLTFLKHPLFGLLMGALLTGVIQSSAASIGILQALSMTGTITVGMAIPIVMGQNIGSCATGMLAAVGANQNARRAAAANLYINIIGTAACFLGYAFRPLVGDYLSMSANPVNIAVFHSVFNVASTAVLMFFVGPIEKLVCMTVRERDELMNYGGETI